MQKYDEKALYMAANKILGKYIKEIQSKIDKYMTSQPKDAKAVIFKDYIANNQDWYEGYSIYSSNMIGLYVYFYNAYDDYNDHHQIVNKIVSIIKSSKLPIPFTVKYASDEQIPIEICVKIDDLAKLDPSIKLKNEISERDAHDIILNIAKKNESAIKNIIARIFKKYKIDDICEIYDLDTHGFHDNNDYYIELYLSGYDPYNSDAIDPDSKEFEKMMANVCSDIERSIKPYIPFKFEVWAYVGEGICACIKYDDIKNHKDALKYLNEHNNISNIFESVRFI